MPRERALSQRLSSSLVHQMQRPRHSRVASDSFISSDGLYKGQVVSPGKANGGDHTYLNHDDVKRRAIQIFHTEGRQDNASKTSIWQLFLRIIHPYDRFRRMFDVATVVFVLVLVFYIPLEIGFDWYEAPTGLKMLFIALDFWFAVDIVLNFRTGYVNYGVVVMDPKKIASNYLSTWFVVDLLGTLPFEQLISGHVSSRKSLKLVKYFKIPKLLRVSRVLKFFRNHKYVYDLSKVLLVLFTLLHVGACMWVLVIDPCDETAANFSGYDVCGQDNVYHVYSEALHISATMLLGVSNFHIVGKPQLMNLAFEGRLEDSTLIYLVSTLYMIVGLFLIALLISETNVYVSGKMQGSAAFQRKTDRVNHEMEYYGVPDDLQRQVRAFYDYVWIHQKQYDEKIALLSDEQMSTDLQRKLALHLFKDTVSHISFFSEIDDLLLGEICLSLRTRIYLPGDMILYKGDVGRELFIIAKGVVEVLRDDLPANKRRNAPRIELSNGSFFGEIALVMEVRRTCSVQARTVCEVNILQQDAFDAIVRENPHFARRMNELVVARQLDSCIARSQQKGVDFRISQGDLDRAVEAVEIRQKESLERRQKEPSTATIESSIRSSYNSRADSQSKAAFSPMRVSFENPPRFSTTSGSHHTNTQKANDCADEEAQLDAKSGPAVASDLPVSDVLQDITRRSTRFQDESQIKKLRRTADRHLSELDSEPVLDVVSDSADICSDGEVVKAKAKERGKVFRRRQSGRIQDSTAADGAAATTVDDVDSLLTGHFTPGKCVVDINKVRPVILNKQPEQPRAMDDGDVTSMNARLSLQSKLMEQLMEKIDELAKLDRLENRARVTIARDDGPSPNAASKEE